MSIVNTYPLSVNYELLIDKPFEPPESFLKCVDQLWEKEKKKKGKQLSNGKSYCLLEHDKNFLRIQPSEYRYVLARIRYPNLINTGLRIHPLAVTGILLCADGLVLGKRSEKVSTNIGQWESTPAGGLSQPDPELQVLEELEEELGLSPSYISSIKICGLIEDVKSGVFDIIFKLNTAASGQVIKERFKSLGSNEYSELAIIHPSHIQPFLKEHNSELLPTLQPMLKIANLI